MSEPLRLARGSVKKGKSSERRKISAGTLVKIHVIDQVELLLKCVVSRDDKKQNHRKQPSRMLLPLGELLSKYLGISTGMNVYNSCQMMRPDRVFFSCCYQPVCSD